MNLGRPMRPDEVPAVKAATIPPEVFDVWNAVIADAAASGRGVRGQATIQQGTIVKALCDRLKVERAHVYANHWLDVEDVYRAQGWSVHFDKPAYCETYEAYFVFTPATKRSGIEGGLVYFRCPRPIGPSSAPLPLPPPRSALTAASRSISSRDH